MGELALLQVRVCVLACVACKCANCALAEFTHVTIVFKGVREYSVFQNFLCGGKKIKNIGSVSVSV